MKLILPTLLGLTLTFSAYAQSQQTKKIKSSTNKITASEDIGTPAMSADFNSTSVDTIHITKGKPTLLLINVQGQNTAGFRDIREEKEVAANFDKTKLQIINIKRHSFLVFENNQTLDVSNFENTYESKAFWNGKSKEKIQTEEGIQNSTEFFSKQLKIKKESSYIINARKYKKEIAALTKKNIITDKSKDAMNMFLNNYSSALAGEIPEVKTFEQIYNKTKSIKAYISDKKTKKQLFRSLEFNEKGQPKLIALYKENNKLEGQFTFEYENGMLKKINLSETKHISINYNDNKIILLTKLDDAEKTEVYWIENDLLLSKEFRLANDDNLAYNNIISEEKLKDDCKIKFFNDQLLRKECFTKREVIPFTYTFTSYQDDDILQFYKTKIIKKNENSFEKFISEADDPKEYKDNFKLFGVFQLNDKKQITSFKFTKDKIEKTIKVEYTYFQ